MSAEADDEARDPALPDLRRSGRTNTSRASKDIRREGEAVTSQQRRDSDPGPDGGGFKNKALASSTAVRKAMDDLVDMERNFRQETKRQKLQLAESSIPTHRGLSQRKDSKAGPAADIDPEGRENSPTTIGTFPTAEEIIQTSKESGKTGADRHGAAEDADADGAIERGAARRPAVNSSYLPLP